MFSKSQNDTLPNVREFFGDLLKKASGDDPKASDSNSYK